jgi:hypothetical protein
MKILCYLLICLLYQPRAINSSNSESHYVAHKAKLCQNDGPAIVQSQSH